MLETFEDRVSSIESRVSSLEDRVSSLEKQGFLEYAKTRKGLRGNDLILEERIIEYCSHLR